MSKVKKSCSVGAVAFFTNVWEIKDRMNRGIAENCASE